MTGAARVRGCSASGGDRGAGRWRTSVLPAYHHGTSRAIMVLAVFAMGYNIAFGYTGLLSLGHAMFFAAGLYGAGLPVLSGSTACTGPR